MNICLQFSLCIIWDRFIFNLAEYETFDAKYVVMADIHSDLTRIKLLKYSFNSLHNTPCFSQPRSSSTSCILSWNVSTAITAKHYSEDLDIYARWSGCDIYFYDNCRNPSALIGWFSLSISEETHEIVIYGTRQGVRAVNLTISYRKKNKLTSVFNAFVLLLTMNFVITLSK